LPVLQFTHSVHGRLYKIRSSIVKIICYGRSAARWVNEWNYRELNATRHTQLAVVEISRNSLSF